MVHVVVEQEIPDDRRHLAIRERHVSTVVRRRGQGRVRVPGRVHGPIFAGNFDRVGRHNDGVGVVLHGHHLGVYRGVATGICDGPAAVERVVAGAIAIDAKLQAVGDGQGAFAVVRGCDCRPRSHGWYVVAFHGHVLGTGQHHRVLRVVACDSHRGAQDAPTVVHRLKQEFGVFVARFLCGRTSKIDHDVACRAFGVLPVQRPAPAEPTTKAVVAVVVVRAFAQLETRGVRRRVVVNEKGAFQFTVAFESAHGGQIEHRNGVCIQAASVVRKQRMLRRLREPLRRHLLVVEAGVDVENLVGVFAAVHRARQAGGLAVWSMTQSERVVGVLQEILAINKACFVEVVKANSSVHCSKVALRVQLGRGGHARCHREVQAL